MRARIHTHKQAAGHTAVKEAAAAEEERAAEEEARGGDLGGERGECDSGRESDRRGCLMRCVCYRQGACQGLRTQGSKGLGLGFRAQGSGSLVQAKRRGLEDAQAQSLLTQSTGTW